MEKCPASKKRSVKDYFWSCRVASDSLSLSHILVDLYARDLTDPSRRHIPRSAEWDAGKLLPFETPYKSCRMDLRHPSCLGRFHKSIPVKMRRQMYIDSDELGFRFERTKRRFSFIPFYPPESPHSRGQERRFKSALTAKRWNSVRFPRAFV